LLFTLDLAPGASLDFDPREAILTAPDKSTSLITRGPVNEYTFETGPLALTD
jgi:hypothetical protein